MVQNQQRAQKSIRNHPYRAIPFQMGFPSLYLPISSLWKSIRNQLKRGFVLQLDRFNDLSTRSSNSPIQVCLFCFSTRSVHARSIWIQWNQLSVLVWIPMKRSSHFSIYGDSLVWFWFGLLPLTCSIKCLWLLPIGSGLDSKQSELYFGSGSGLDYCLWRVR